MCVDLPDLDWYLDQVVVPAGPDRRPIGPMRAWQASWQARAQALLRGCAGRDAQGAVVRRALHQGFVVTRAQANALGVTHAQLRRLVRAGIWWVPHRGVVGVLTPATPMSISSRHAGHETAATHALAAARAALVRSGHVISGASAAVLHDLPRLREPARLVLSARAPSRMGARGSVLVRSAALAALDVTIWHGVAVTTIARTIADLARHDRASGLVAADAAMHEGLVSASELCAVADRCAGSPGARGARSVLRMASALAESPLESLTRLGVSDAGLPDPQLQAWINGPGWRYRVDMLWPAERVIVEADGRVKYIGGELWNEKRRQERIERFGYRVVRVLWDDMTERLDETVARIRAALQSSTRPPLTR